MITVDMMSHLKSKFPEYDFQDTTTLEKSYPDEVFLEYKNHLYDMLEKEYTEDYHAPMKHLSILLEESNTKQIYKELGINQGTSLAYALAQDAVKEVIGIDTDISPVVKFLPLFTSFAISHGKKMAVYEVSSLEPHAAKNNPCDILYIDTVHKGEHLIKELRLHQEFVSNAIIMHDTHCKGMLDAIDKFLDEHDDWDFYLYNEFSVGTMTIKRKNTNHGIINPT